MADRLYRSRDDRMLAGVAGGVAEMIDADPSIIRVAWVLLVFLTGGIALIAYIAMAIVVPEGPLGGPAGATAWGSAGATAADGATTDGGATTRATTPGEPVAPGDWIAPDGSTVPMAAAAPRSRPARQRHPDDRARGGLIAGLILILIGAFFLIQQFVPSIDLGLWWPVAAIALGVLMVVLAVMPSRRGG